jgi:hypothetical protein
LTALELKVDLLDLIDALYQFRGWRPQHEAIPHVSQRSDLQLIRDFASSLQQLSDVSTTMDKLWVLCNVMSKVAVMYVEAKRLHVVEDLRPAINEFDNYLGQLGFVTNETAGQDVQNPPQCGSQMIQYDDWFLSSRTMMDLLQHDLSDIGV